MRNATPHHRTTVPANPFARECTDQKVENPSVKRHKTKVRESKEDKQTRPRPQHLYYSALHHSHVERKANLKGPSVIGGCFKFNQGSTMPEVAGVGQTNRVRSWSQRMRRPKLLRQSLVVGLLVKPGLQERRPKYSSIQKQEGPWWSQPVL